MKENHLNDRRKFKCDKRKKRDPYRQSAKRRYQINGSKKHKKKKYSQNDCC